MAKLNFNSTTVYRLLKAVILSCAQYLLSAYQPLFNYYIHKHTYIVIVRIDPVPLTTSPPPPPSHSSWYFDNLLYVL